MYHGPMSGRRTAEPADPALGSELLTLVARLNRLATSRIRLPLPWAQARLLGTIEDRRDGTRISELAELDHCSQPTMTTQVRRLEEAGLVSRATDPDDARAVLIRITPKGSHALARVRADRAAVIEPRIQNLSGADRATLTAAVGALHRLIEDMSSASD